MTIRIRPAEDRDRPDLHRMMAGLQDVERAIHPESRPSGAGMAEEHVALLRRIAEEQRGLFVVAEAETGIVGFLFGHVEIEDEPYLSPAYREVGRVGDIWVDPEQRGTDLADRLLDTAEAHFRSLGLTVMILSYLTGNDRAERAYLKRGFSPLETILERKIR